MRIECLNPAYSKIVKSGLDKKILEKKHLIGYDVLLHRSIYFENCEEFFNKEKDLFLNPNRKISSQSETSRKILELEKEFNGNYFWDPDEFGKLLIKYPAFLGKIVLGEEIHNYEKFGFSSQKSLEESISAFCIGEQEIFYFSRTKDFWRTGNLKKGISLNSHGDLYAYQINVFGKSRIENTLFGDVEVFEIYKEDAESSGISAHQDWSEFLLAALKYAQFLGKKEIPEIKNWKDFLESLGGGRGTATSEAMSETNFSEGELGMLMETPILRDNIKLEGFPLAIYSKFNSFSYPYISENKLFYLIENESGNISLEKFSHIYKDKNFSKVLEYSEEDLIPILSATYKYFARDRSKMTKILDYFNSKNN